MRASLVILGKKGGFTLVEMLVSMVILSIILLVLSQVTGALQSSISQTTGEVHVFEAAQDAFEAMTRRIGQATLNSYNDSAQNAPLNPSPYTNIPGYTRASELRFISGPASVNSSPAANGVSGPLFASASPYHPTQAIFFQAPLGKAVNTNFANLNQMLNTCGYYIEWNTDTATTATGLGIVPQFIPGTYIPRWRYRLMEMIEPSDSLTIYTDTSGGHNNGQANNASNSWWYQGRDWFQTPYNNSNSASSIDYQCARPIADNIIALAFLPMVAPQNALYPPGGALDGTSTDLMSTPSTSAGGNSGYLYDSAPVQALPIPVTQNQLPPMVYVLMIAVDEKSFSVYQLQRGNSSSPPTNLGIDGPGGTIFTNSAYQARQNDISQITTALNLKHIRYRIFATAIPLTAH